MILILSCLFPQIVQAATYNYGPPFWRNSYDLPDGRIESPNLDQAIALIWDAYRRYWGVQPYGNRQCEYARADTDNGPETGLFSVLTITGECGTTAPIYGTALRADKDVGVPTDCGVGNPCDPTNGNKYHTDTDYRSEDGTLAFVRSYNSNNGAGSDSGIGHGWLSSLHKRLEIFGPVMQVRRADGRGAPFTKNSPGQWLGDPDSQLTLTQDVSGYTLARPDGVLEYYDPNGRLLSETSSAGQTTTYGYDTNGRLATITSPFGQTLAFGYDANNHVSTLTDPTGQVIDYIYDAKNNLSRVNYPDGTAKIYHYEKNNFPHALTGISHVDAAGIETRYSTYGYNSYAQAVTTQHAQTDNGAPQEKFTLVYNSGTQTTVIDPVNMREVMYFTVNLGIKNLILKSNVSDSKSVRQTFDTRNNLTCKKDEEDRVTLYSYNVANQKIGMTEGLKLPTGGTCSTCLTNPASCNTGGVARTTTYEYLSPTLDLPRFIRRPSVAAGQTFETEMVYSDAGHPNLPTQIIQRGYTPSGTAVSRAVTLGYNAFGQVNLINGPRTDVNDVTTLEYYECSTGGGCGQLMRVTNALGHITTYDLYDANGRLTQMTDPNGLRTSYTYDARGRVRFVTQTPPTGTARVTEYRYTAFGEVAQAIFPDGVSLTYVYDAAQDLKTVTDNLGNRIEYRYDLKGNRTREYTYDPDGTLVRQVDLAHDLRNRVSQINNAGNITQLVHDAVGNLTREVAPNNYPSTAPATQHTPDALNRLVQTIDRLGGTTAYGYDHNDRPTQVTPPGKSATQYTYDDLDNQLKEVSPDRGTTTYTYDAAGNLKTMLDARNKLVSYSYDALNRVTFIDYPGTNEDITFTYDTGAGCASGIGRLCRVQDNSGSTTYAYNSLGHLMTTVHTEMGVAHTTSFNSDAVGRLLSLTYPGGRQVSYTRDALGRVTHIATTVNGLPVTLLSNRTYRADGLLKSQTFGNGLAETRGYDLQGQLRTQGLGNVDNRSYDYDLNGNLIYRQSASQAAGYIYNTLDRLQLDDQAGAFTYDANGNRQSKAGIPYSYNPNSNQLVQVGSESFNLDPAGNLLNDDTRLFTYYGSGRLRATLTETTGATSYYYNVQGLRTRKTNFWTGNIVYHYDRAGRLILETGGIGQLFRAYVWDDDIPIAQITKNLQTGQENLVYLLTDHQGTPRLATNPQGVVVWRWEGAAFGDTAPHEDPDGDGNLTTINLRYAGQYFDSETGLHYNWNRYYDPKTGRYITSDPIGLKGGLNTYAYVENNPLRWIDPTGLEKVCKYVLGDYYDKTITELVKPELGYWKPLCILLTKPQPNFPDPIPRRMPGFPIDPNMQMDCSRTRWVVTQEAEYRTTTEKWMWGWMECTDTCTGEVTKHWMPDRPANDPPKF